MRALAEKGAANTALSKVVAAWLGVPQGDVALIAGAKTRIKTLLITGDGPELAKRATARLDQA